MIKLISGFMAGLSDLGKILLTITLIIVVAALFDRLLIGPTMSRIAALEEETLKEEQTIKEDLRFLSYKNKILKEASEETALKGLLNYSEEPLVSIDYNHNPASSTVDATQTRVLGDFIKVLAWYDNEWGFSNRMLDVTTALMRAN